MMYNPYQPYMQNQQIIRVNGVESAKAYQMLPNSSALLLDESAPRIFLKTVDAIGNSNLTAYKLEQYVEEPTPDLNNLSERIKKLEEMINAKSNTSNAFKRKQAESEQAE